MNKLETLGRETVVHLNNGVDPFVVNAGINDGSPLSEVGAGLDLAMILDLIIDFIGKLLVLRNENCPQGPFSRLVRRAGPFQRHKARTVWAGIEKSSGVDTGLSAHAVVRAAESVALSKPDSWLDEAAAEVAKPDWGF